MYSVKPVFFPLVLLCNALFIHAGCLYKAKVMRENWEEVWVIHDLLHRSANHISKLPKGDLAAGLWSCRGGPGSLQCAIASSAAGPHPSKSCAFLLSRVLFLSVQPGRHLNCVLVKLPSVFSRAALVFALREVVAETSPWHIVSHCTHSSALFLLLVWYIQMLLFNLAERCFIVEVHSFSFTHIPAFSESIKA